MNAEASQAPGPPARVVMFSDVADSSRLYRELGEEAASRLVSELLDGMQASLQAGRGRVLDRIGDELLCIFERPTDALLAALALEGVVEQQVARAGLAHPIFLRTGLYSGRVLERDGEIFGDCVYAAKRVTDLAKAGQILVCPVLGEAADEIGVPCRFLQVLTLKGQREPTSLFELLRDAPEETLISPSAPLVRSKLILTLQYMGQSFVAEPGQRLSIGRLAPSELRIDSPRVSRLHAKLVNHGDHVLLEDVSTNGTYIARSGAGTSEYLRHSVTVLEGGGLIGLGEEPDPARADQLHFQTSFARSTDAPSRTTSS